MQEDAWHRIDSRWKHGLWHNPVLLRLAILMRFYHLGRSLCGRNEMFWDIICKGKAWMRQGNEGMRFMRMDAHQLAHRKMAHDHGEGFQASASCDKLGFLREIMS